ncbi:hypothetical protein ACO0LF_15295 [Undibacterium sp. Di27W]|uniref:hypothetical protein n=1 Tax=Undibacterium sp. Di27W TaxID=3413036 RepID=UPI003BF0F92D
MFEKMKKIVFSIGYAASLSACSGEKVWKEEVRLNDGRIITVIQKRNCDSGSTGDSMASCIERESWLTVNLPETKNQDVQWHEHLKPKIFNVYQGNLYIVATPATAREYRKYGYKDSLYLCFKWDHDQWKRITLSDLPVAIYDTNLVIDGAFLKTNFLTLAEKNGRDFNGSSSYPDYFKRIDPNKKSSFD